MKAIVAPNLEWFDYMCIDRHGDPPSATFDTFDSKFANVRHLVFSWTRDASNLRGAEALVLCQAFPGVRHLTLKGRQLPYLFERHDSTHLIGSWADLESLTLDGLHYYWPARDSLLDWLVERRAFGLQLLRVKFIKQIWEPANTLRIRDDRYFFMLFEQLKENCILELDNFEFMPRIYLSMSEGSPLQVVRAVSNASLTIEHHFHHHIRVWDLIILPRTTSVDETVVGCLLSDAGNVDWRDWQTNDP